MTSRKSFWNVSQLKIKTKLQFRGHTDIMEITWQEAPASFTVLRKQSKKVKIDNDGREIVCYN